MAKFPNAWLDPFNKMCWCDIMHRCDITGCNSQAYTKFCLCAGTSCVWGLGVRTPIKNKVVTAADPGFENRGAQPKMSGLKKNRAPCIRHCRGRGYRTRLIIYILLFMSKMDICIICFFYTVRQEGRIIYFAFTHHPQTLNHRIGFFNNKIHHGKPCKWVGAEEMAHMTYQKCKWTTYRPKTKRVS